MNENLFVTHEAKPAAKSTEFDIIVPSHNRVELTIRCIDAL